MNVPQILNTADSWQAKMIAEGRKIDQLARMTSEARLELALLKDLGTRLNSHGHHIDMVVQGHASPSLDLNEFSVARTATEIVVRESRLFYLCLDIASFLKSVGATDKCLDL